MVLNYDSNTPLCVNLCTVLEQTFVTVWILKEQLPCEKHLGLKAFLLCV